jgi:hypothetical protein
LTTNILSCWALKIKAGNRNPSQIAWVLCAIISDPGIVNENEARNGIPQSDIGIEHENEARDGIPQFKMRLQPHYYVTVGIPFQ